MNRIHGLRQQALARQQHPVPRAHLNAPAGPAPVPMPMPAPVGIVGMGQPQVAPSKGITPNVGGNIPGWGSVVKDALAPYLHDDRAVQVIPNSGPSKGMTPDLDRYLASLRPAE